MVADLLISALDIAFLGGLVIIINYYVTGSSKQLFAWGYFNNPSFAAGAFLLLYCLKNWLGYKAMAMANSFCYQVASRLSRAHIMQYLDDEYSQFVSTNSAAQIRKISQQPVEFSNYILTNIQQIVTQAILIVLSIAAVIFYRPFLFLGLFVLLLPPVVLLAWFIKKQLSSVRKHIKTNAEVTLQYLQESLTGYVEGKIYGKTAFFAGRYATRQQGLNQNLGVLQSLQALPARLIEVFAIMGFFLLILLNSVFAHSPANVINIGVMMAASYKIIPGIVKILNSAGQIKTYAFIIPDLKIKNNVTELAEKAKDKIHSVKFEQVCFSYKHDQLLDNLSFELKPGDFAGITGASGTGKTTIINLLLGFYSPASGSIRINDKSLNKEGRQAYFDKISYVKQQPFFINDSVLKNIVLDETGYDADKIGEVLSFCGIEKMITPWPEGIHKVITENGKNLSGGQRQRMMLARALYHDFDLLILDEPFSELDENAEKQMLIKLGKLAEAGKMILFITHNKSSLAYCNKLLSPEIVYEN